MVRRRLLKHTSDPIHNEEGKTEYSNDKEGIDHVSEKCTD
jgi:hypothetical protein